MILTGDNKAQTLNLTANGGHITQSGGSIVGNTLNATTNTVGKAITVTNADFSSADLNTKFGDIKYTDTDGISVHFDTGNTSGTTANITSGNGANLNGGAETSGIQITGANQTGLANLTAKAGNITQGSGSLTTNTSNLVAENGGIIQSGGSMSSVDLNLTATNGDITQSNGTMSADNVILKTTNGSIQKSGGSMSGNTVSMNTTNGSINQTGGSVTGGIVNLTANNGTIAQTGGTLTGSILTARTDSTAGKSITLNNTDFTDATLKTQNGTINFTDSDGVNVNVDAGASGIASITTGTGSAATNGTVENNLHLTGVNTAGTLNLVANHWDISQAVGSTVSGITLNTETKSFGRATNLTDADFNQANLKSKHGNITYNDADSIIVNVQAGDGTVTINSKAPGLASNNSSDGNGGMTLTGDKPALR